MKRTMSICGGILSFAATASLLAQTPTFTTLYSFTGNQSLPIGSVAIGAGGVLYGTTYGEQQVATAYSLTPPAVEGGAWTQNLIYTFPENLQPIQLAVGQNGDLYGSTDIGGSGTLCSGGNGCGTIFSLVPPASPGAPWTNTVLYTFTGGTDGAGPNIVPTISKDGVLYGTTSSTVYSLSPPVVTGGPWTFNLLYTFGPNDGATSSLAIGPSGTLYGTDYSGGMGPFCPGGCGTVFALAPPKVSGAAWTAKVLYNFQGSSDGSTPYSGVTIGAGGVLYGTTYDGGTGNCAFGLGGCGTVYSLAPPGNPGGEWTHTVLHEFTGQSSDALGDGANPYAGITVGHNGVLYGATFWGGRGRSQNGVAFSLVPPAAPDGTWTEYVLHAFPGGAGNGDHPEGTLVMGSGGVLYGTTQDGGPDNDGTVFSLVP